MKVPLSFIHFFFFSMNSNFSLNSRQSIKMLTLMSCETRQHTPFYGQEARILAKLTFNIMMTKHPHARSPQNPQKGLIHLRLSSVANGRTAFVSAVCSQVEFRLDLLLPLENVTGLLKGPREQEGPVLYR